MTLRSVLNDDATQPLLPADGTTPRENDSSTTSDSEHRRIRHLLYVSHFLSTWNSRVFEFGAFLFLAEVYPKTLLPASIYALTRAASGALFSPWLGFYIDSVDRLQVIRLSILSQRLAVAFSCVGLFCIAVFEILRENVWAHASLLVILSALAAVEKLGSVTNTIAVERDWVVAVAAGNEDCLRMLNSQMRRIDLFCKLVGPLAVAVVDSISPAGAVIGTGGMSAASVALEYFSIAKVYNVVPALRRSRTGLTRSRTRMKILDRFSDVLFGTKAYVRHPAFLASFSLALLYLTVLSFSGQMITYLVALGLPSAVVGVLRGVSAIFELSATWIAPYITKRIGPIRGGIWFLNWQITCVAVACVIFWLDCSPNIEAAGTVCAVIASRVGLWGFDLSAQIIVQEEVEAEDRGVFSTQEFALQNSFEMLAFMSTIIFPRPAQFKYPATGSAAAVCLAGILYAIFVRRRRGHLIHLSQCIDPSGAQKDHRHWWMMIPPDDESLEPRDHD